MFFFLLLVFLSLSVITSTINCNCVNIVSVLSCFHPDIVSWLKESQVRIVTFLFQNCFLHIQRLSFSHYKGSLRNLSTICRSLVIFLTFLSYILLTGPHFYLFYFSNYGGILLFSTNPANCFCIPKWY